MKNGRLFVFSGASGVGKSTVLSLVMSGRDDLQFSVSATTRTPRPDEVDGVNYYFVSKAQFEEMIQQDAFFEYDEHMDNFYGTPKSQIDEKLHSASVVLDIEPIGALNVKRQRPDAVLIFIIPPSLEELERRLRGRGDTSEEQIQMRLERARWEMEQSVYYDHVVINDRVDTCVEEILNIICKTLEEN